MALLKAVPTPKTCKQRDTPGVLELVKHLSETCSSSSVLNTASRSNVGDVDKAAFEIYCHAIDHLKLELSLTPRCPTTPALISMETPLPSTSA